MKKSVLLLIGAIYLVAFLLVGFLGNAIKSYGDIIYVDDILVVDADNGKYMKQSVSADYDYWFVARPSVDSITVRIKATVSPANTNYPDLDFIVPPDENYTFTVEQGIYGVVSFHDLEEGEPIACPIRIMSTDGKNYSKTVGILCLYI